MKPSLSHMRRPRSTHQSKRLRRVPHVLAGTTVVVLLPFVLVGCAASNQEAGSRKSVALPTSSWAPGQPGRLAQLEGVVEGGADTGCVWIRAASKKVRIVWPRGYAARFNPLEILDGSGRVVARGGDRVRLGGGFAPPKDSHCTLGDGEAFWVQSEVKVL